MTSSRPEPRPAATPPAAGRSRRPARRGQAMVEFAFVLLPLLVIVVGIIQFGFLFAANISLTNAAREAARAATIYRYVGDDTNAQHGVNRCTDAVEAATGAFGLLTAAAPHFSAGSPCPAGADLNGDGMHDRWLNGDAEISFCAGGTAAGSACPDTSDASTYCTTTNGQGCLVRVQLAYNQTILVPLLDAILDDDGNGLFRLTADAAMVMN